MSIGSALQGSFLPLEDIPQQRVLAVGLGGAGNDLLTHLMDSYLNGVYCIAADTDRYHLQITRAHSKLLMEDPACPDAGTGGDVMLGRKVALQASQTLKGALDDAELVFVLAGMGGGTGSGAAPIVTDFARKQVPLVVGLLTKPFSFETSKLPVAIDSLRLMLNTCDTVILLDSQSTEPSELILPFGLRTDTTGHACCAVVASIVQTFTQASLLNGEPSDLRAMLRRGGLAKVGMGESYSVCGAEEAVLNALRNTVPLGDLSIANGVFVDIVGDETMADSDVARALDLITRQINPGAEVLCGRRVDANMHGATRVNLLVTGVSFPYSWSGYRKLPIEIYELEPESGEDENIGVDLGLNQLEDFSVHENL